MDVQQSIGESNAEHKHNWPRSGGGCWCGAQQCRYMIPREKKTVYPEGRTPASGYKARAAAKDLPLSDRCKEGAALPSPYCAVHKGIVEAKRA